MEIVLDARYLSKRYSGIATYSQCLVEHLSRLDTENHYRVLVHKTFKGRLEVGENFEIVPHRARPVSLQTLSTVSKVCKGRAVDVFHSFFPLAPLGLTTPLLVTLHDLQPFWDPQFSARRPRWIRAAYDKFYHWVYPATLHLARWIVVDSEATRSGLRDLFPELAPKAIVVPLGLSESAFQLPGAEEIAQVKTRYNLDSSYFLYYGSTRPNKNLPNLLEGYARFRKQHPELGEVLMVMVVQADRFFHDAMAVIRREGIRGDVRLLQPVSEHERKALLCGASVFCFPSRYEGFGLPVLEAQAAGTPALASTSAALPETGGPGAAYVDPDDVDAMAEKLFQLHADAALRATLIEAGRENCRRFSWAETARQTLEIYSLLF
jgi:glycosyltransferase involved in cell wall biosynthesis